MEVIPQSRRCRVPGQGLGFGGKFHLGIPEGGGQVRVHAVDLQRQAAGQCVAPAFLMDQRLADEVFQPGKQFRVDLGLDLLPAEGALSFKTEHQRRGAALQGLPPDAHGGPHADVPLVHPVILGHGQTFRPAGDHPFAFNLHSMSSFLIPTVLYQYTIFYNTRAMDNFASFCAGYFYDLSSSPVAFWRRTPYNGNITARALRMCFRSALSCNPILK